jgi:hypothetical protein
MFVAMWFAFPAFGMLIGGGLPPKSWYPMLAIASAMLILVGRPERTDRDYRHGDGKSGEERIGHMMSRLLVPTLYSAFLFSVLTEIKSQKALVVATGVTLVLLLVAEALRLRGVRGHAILLGAPPWNGQVDARVLVEGTVRDPTPVTVGRGETAVARETAYDRGIGSDPDKVKWRRLHNEGTFLVDAAAGVVEIDPAETLWASTVVDAPVSPSSDYEVVEQIPIGGKVAATGWIEAGSAGGPPRLRSRGTTPAYLLATSNLGDPRGMASALLWHRRITLGGVLVLLAAYGISFL